MRTARRTRTISGVTALFIAMIVVGVAYCAVAVVWARQARPVHRAWRAARRDVHRTAVVLELAERVRELESS